MFQLFSDPNHFELVNSIFWDILTLLCVKGLQVLSGGTVHQLYFISKLKSVIFYRRINYVPAGIKYMTAVACGIDETATMCGFFGKTFYFYNLFSESATLTVYLFISLFVNPHLLSYYFSALNIIQGFSLNRLQRKNFRTRS